MNRRGFLRSLIGGVAAASAVRSWPFRVFSFPEKPKITTVPEAVRFLKMYDANQSKMVNRWDVLVGFGALYPDCAVRIEGLDDDPVENTLRSLEVFDAAEQGISSGPEGPTSDWQVLRLQKGYFGNGVVRMLS